MEKNTQLKSFGFSQPKTAPQNWVLQKKIAKIKYFLPAWVLSQNFCMNKIQNTQRKN